MGVSHQMLKMQQIQFQLRLNKKNFLHVSGEPFSGTGKESMVRKGERKR